MGRARTELAKWPKLLNEIAEEAVVRTGPASSDISQYALIPACLLGIDFALRIG